MTVPDLRPTGAKRLREMLADPAKVIVAPGVFDGFTARLALAQDFECLYMTGAGTSLSKLGAPDLGLCTQTDMLQNVSMLASLSPSTPLIADADTGYGNPIMVARTVREYARAGVAALHLEDQVQSKRCGHLMGKQLVAREEFWSRIRAARASRDACESEMLLIARTDARAGVLVGHDPDRDPDGADNEKVGAGEESEGEVSERKYQEAITRLRGAVRAGADVLFFEAPVSKAEAARACRDLAPTPMLLNMVPEGVTPNMSVEEAKEAGFVLLSVSRVS